MNIERVGPFLWRIPPDARPGMRVPALVVADDALMTAIQSDASLEQIANGATLPGVVKAALAMPDMHQGYGFPVGGVAATDAAADGVISPAASASTSTAACGCCAPALAAADVMPRLPALVDELYARDPDRGTARRSDSCRCRGESWRRSWSRGQRGR